MCACVNVRTYVHTYVRTYVFAMYVSSYLRIWYVFQLPQLYPLNLSVKSYKLLVSLTMNNDAYFTYVYMYVNTYVCVMCGWVYVGLK